MRNTYHENDLPIVEACCVLAEKGILLYPTDTLYALGADPEQPEAMRKLFALKRREKSKRVSYIFSNMQQAEQYARITETAKKLEKYLPGKLTVILESRDGQETVGVRIPDNAFCLALAEAYGPVTTTSANISGEKELRTTEEITREITGIDLIVDGGTLPGPGSTVVDARGDKPVVIRQGPVVIE